ncbi:hypothetical protein E2C01_101192 [Portunus trituberculatus]|uniref:Secreted protein n=1 Tax=Portunus trituberculatus TaxID=210409 RepID=A0A5B7KFH9_PORTR|nr:hypothetical protein [Portunus trituberculatus]
MKWWCCRALLSSSFMPLPLSADHTTSNILLLTCSKWQHNTNISVYVFSVFRHWNPSSATQTVKYQLLTFMHWHLASLSTCMRHTPASPP